MSEIKEIKAYKVGNKLFENKENAERYKIECFDPCQIGDIVSTSGFRSIMDTFAPFGKPTILGSEGRVSCIEDNGNKIYFVIGNCPNDIIMSGAIKNGAKKYKYGGIEYSWSIGCLQRKGIFRRPLPWVNIECSNLCKFLV